MTRLRLLLNSSFSGANLFFTAGIADGSFAAAGLDLAFTPGRGAWTAARRLADGEFDLAYGDVNALLQVAAQACEPDLPKAICALHQHSPAVIAVPIASSVHRAADLAGRRIAGHASDVALQLFPAYAHASDLDPQSVEQVVDDRPMGALLMDLLAGRHEAVFGYASTHAAALAGLGESAARRLRFLRYREACPWLYGSALMASAELVRSQPERVRLLVHVLQGRVESLRGQPAQALHWLAQQVPGVDLTVEHARWLTTAREDMALDDLDGPARGVFDANRFRTGIDAQAHAFGWRTPPGLARVLVPWSCAKSETD